MFVLLASSDYDNSVASDDHSTLSQLPHSSTLSCRPVWITVKQFRRGAEVHYRPAATHVVSDTRKFDRGLSRLMHTELHWLDVPERVQYKLGVLMYRCQHNQAPQSLKTFLFSQH